MRKYTEPQANQEPTLESFFADDFPESKNQQISSTLTESKDTAHAKWNACTPASDVIEYPRRYEDGTFKGHSAMNPVGDELFKLTKDARLQKVRTGLRRTIKTMTEIGYKQYALTVMYKFLPDNADLTPEIAEGLFKTFYMTFLDQGLYEDRKWRKNTILSSMQPLGFALPELHGKKDAGNGFAARNHHHAVIAVHPDFQEKMDRFLGEKTMLYFSDRVAQTMLKETDDGWIDYMSKMYRPDVEAVVRGPKWLPEKRQLR